MDRTAPELDPIRIDALLARLEPAEHRVCTVAGCVHELQAVPHDAPLAA